MKIKRVKNNTEQWYNPYFSTVWVDDENDADTFEDSTKEHVLRLIARFASLNAAHDYIFIEDD